LTGAAPGVVRVGGAPRGSTTLAVAAEVGDFTHIHGESRGLSPTWTTLAVTAAARWRSVVMVNPRRERREESVLPVDRAFAREFSSLSRCSRAW